MKIMLLQCMSYLSSGGGLPKGTRGMIEGLAERGHSCKVVAPASGRQNPETKDSFIAGLRAQGIPILPSPSGVVIFHSQGVEVHAVIDVSHLRAYGIKQIYEFDPNWVFVPEEPTYSLLKGALEASPSRVVYLAYSSALLGLGPMCFYPMPIKKGLLRQTAGIIAVSNYLKDYIWQWAECKSIALQSLVYGSGPFPHFGAFDKGFVTMINPCAYKGIAIFLALAQAMPDIQFAAVPTWGTTKKDLADLEQLPNVTLLKPTANIDEIYKQTRVLLVPSLWDETLGVVATEAMLHGIPVLASRVGGLPEAKHGIDYVLPVRPIEYYGTEMDDRMLPRPVVPKQDVGPWLESLRRLLSNRAHYETLSNTSRKAAQTFVSGLSASLYEDYLETLMPRPRSDHEVMFPTKGQTTQTEKIPLSSLSSMVAKLSPEKRALLSQRLRKGR